MKIKLGSYKSIINGACDRVGDHIDDGVVGHEIELYGAGAGIAMAFMQSVACQLEFTYTAEEVAKLESQFADGMHDGLTQYANQFGVAVQTNGQTEFFHGRKH